jgi:hypothetical protein
MYKGDFRGIAGRLGNSFMTPRLTNHVVKKHTGKQTAPAAKQSASAVEASPTSAQDFIELLSQPYFQEYCAQRDRQRKTACWPARRPVRIPQNGVS